MCIWEGCETTLPNEVMMMIDEHENEDENEDEDDGEDDDVCISDESSGYGRFPHRFICKV